MFSIGGWSVECTNFSDTRLCISVELSWLNGDSVERDCSRTGLSVTKFKGSIKPSLVGFWLGATTGTGGRCVSSCTGVGVECLSMKYIVGLMETWFVEAPLKIKYRLHVYKPAYYIKIYWAIWNLIKIILWKVVDVVAIGQCLQVTVIILCKYS